jgi:hypothetical protein
MPSRNSNNKNYNNLVQSDEFDSRIPLLPDEAFTGGGGIPFNVKVS